jgi:methylphosphotriester-DNA--protein-cysteine methyltransferase
MTRRRRRKTIKSWSRLSPFEKEQRIRVLEVIRQVRNGTSLSKASKNVGIKSKTIKTIARKILYKRKRR